MIREVEVLRCKATAAAGTSGTQYLQLSYARLLVCHCKQVMLPNHSRGVIFPEPTVALERLAACVLRNERAADEGQYSLSQWSEVKCVFWLQKSTVKLLLHCSPQLISDTTRWLNV